MTVEVIATLVAHPERETEVEAALRVLLTHSRQEPGVRRYDLPMAAAGMDRARQSADDSGRTSAATAS
jgi:quinol monooxygenase YgiN